VKLASAGADRPFDPAVPPPGEASCRIGCVGLGSNTAWRGAIGIGALVACGACGRLNFDLIGDGATGDGATGDGPSAGVLVLRDQLDGYAGTVDTFIDMLDPSTDQHMAPTVRWGGTGQYALLHFDALFGPGAVPAGSTISSATLRLVFAADCTAPNTIAEVAFDWASTSTWDSFGPSPGVQVSDIRNKNALPGFVAGPDTIDVTASVAAWSLDPTRNNGWILGSVLPLLAVVGGCSVLTTDSPDSLQYPQLTVAFVRP